MSILVESPVVGTVWKIQVAVGDAEATGTIISLSVAEGDQVAEGALLATIE